MSATEVPETPAKIDDNFSGKNGRFFFTYMNEYGSATFCATFNLLSPVIKPPRFFVYVFLVPGY